MEDRCVVCGKPIPEGRYVCWSCETKYQVSCIIDSEIWINGAKINKPSKCNKTTIINGKVYVDGYEYKDGQWKRTLKALWHLIF